MNSKRKDNPDKRTGRVAREKGNTVSPDSLQTRAPGAVQRGSANVQSANREAGTVPIRGTRQDVYGASEEGERGGPGVQQAGWSSRQQAQRMEARAEEARRGEPQQSGYGGAEQEQHAGSQESSSGPAGSRQSGSGGPRQG